MVFDMSESAKNYVKSINTYSKSGQIDQWDLYYYCALIGMKHLRMCDKDFHLEEFNKSYSKSYFRSRMLIAAMVVDAELRRVGCDMTKENISDKFSDYLCTSDIVLNSEGIKLLNRYAQGGFEYLNEHASKQTDAFSFISTCISLINEGEPELNAD